MSFMIIFGKFHPASRAAIEKAMRLEQTIRKREEKEKRKK